MHAQTYLQIYFNPSNLHIPVISQMVAEFTMFPSTAAAPNSLQSEASLSSTALYYDMAINTKQYGYFAEGKAPAHLLFTQVFLVIVEKNILHPYYGHHVCQRSSYPILYCKLLYKLGNYILGRWQRLKSNEMNLYKIETCLLNPEGPNHAWSQRKLFLQNFYPDQAFQQHLCNKNLP